MLTAIQLQEGLKVPDGFVKSGYVVPAWRKDTAPGHGVKLERPNDVEIRIEFDGCPPEPGSAWSILATGHVGFETPKGRFSFDRRGVEDSFYVDVGDTVESVDQKIAEQLERVEEARRRLARSVTVPGLPRPFELSPETLSTYREHLKAGRPVSLTPSGFGIGYSISPRRSSYAKPASPALAAFFGTGPLFVSEMDCD
ncbi:MAG: hypothetical protein HY646_02145 [Acidobacteria bacterium]|nr:hypothetical protein [Acidobacteriota bacterium]